MRLAHKFSTHVIMLIRENIHEICLAPTMWSYSKKLGFCKPGRGPLDTESANILILDFHP